MQPEELEIAGRRIGAGRTFVIAEVAWSHDGSVEQAKSLIAAAAQSGADCVSLHVTDLPAYMVPQYGAGEGRVSAGREVSEVYAYLEKINLPADCWPELFTEARERGLGVALMCNDFPSLELTHACAPDLHVLAAACFIERAFVEAVARQGKPVVLRTGGATLGEIERVLAWIRGAAEVPILVLHGQQNYPTKVADTRLLQMRTLARALELPVGLADHVDGDDEMALHVPVAAVALGAPLVEKHITLDRAAKSEDFESALDPAGFARMVAAIRDMEAALGAPTLDLTSPSQDAYRVVCRKRTVAARALVEGQVLRAEDLAFKRADSGLFPDEAERLVGRKLGRSVAANEGLDWETVR